MEAMSTATAAIATGSEGSMIRHAAWDVQMGLLLLCSCHMTSARCGRS